MCLLSIDIAETNHVASLVDDRGTVTIEAIDFKNDTDSYNKLLAALAIFSIVTMLLLIMHSLDISSYP